MSRNRLWLIAGGYVVLALVIGVWSRLAAEILIAAGLIALVLLALRKRPRTGPLSISDTCERCGSLLQERAGLPEPTCRACGHRQSWAR